jgi:hypothetical protein
LNRAILKSDVQDFIDQNLQEDVTRILFRKSPFKDVSAGELATQIEGKKRSEKKLPTWFHTRGIYYPPKISIEQASSEKTAGYKAALIKGNTVIDLTGGLGVDSFAFSKIADEVIHCERNSSLCEIAAHNARIMGVTNTNFINEDGIAYLERKEELFGTIYIDPSRRVNSQKVFRLADCEPDVVSNLDILLQRASRVLIKTSPLLDIQAGLNELKRVTSIHVVSVRNDCKELLWILDKDGKSADLQIICTMLDPDRQYGFSLSEERTFGIDFYTLPGKYLYEPDVALLKAGCFKLITRDFHVSKLHVNTHLYTSETVNAAFPGRIFEVKKQWKFKDFLHGQPIKHANVICRNFPLSTEEVKRKTGIKDGGSDYLIFTTGPADDLMVLNCERI